MKKEKFAYTLLSPMLLIMFALVIYPIIITFSYSMKKWKLSKPNAVKFIGFKNYINILFSKSFHSSLYNTIFILLLVVLFTTIISIAVSLFLNIRVRFSSLLLAISIIPWAVPPFVNALLWKFVFYSGYGFLNKLLINMRILNSPVSWLDNKISLLIIVAFVTSYRLIPFMTLICLSGRHSINEHLIEAAKIDGAGSIYIFQKIILPLMLPFLAIGITQTSIGAINVFDEIVALNGYSDVGKSVLIDSYLTTFSFLDFGKGSAYTYIVMIMAILLGIVYIRSLNKEVDY